MTKTMIQGLSIGILVVIAVAVIIVIAGEIQKHIWHLRQEESLYQIKKLEKKMQEIKEDYLRDTQEPEILEISEGILLQFIGKNKEKRISVTDGKNQVISMEDSNGKKTHIVLVPWKGKNNPSDGSKTVIFENVNKIKIINEL